MFDIIELTIKFGIIDNYIILILGQILNKIFNFIFLY